MGIGCELCKAGCSCETRQAPQKFPGRPRRHAPEAL